MLACRSTKPMLASWSSWLAKRSSGACSGFPARIWPIICKGLKLVSTTMTKHYLWNLEGKRVNFSQPVTWTVKTGRGWVAQVRLLAWDLHSLLLPLQELQECQLSLVGWVQGLAAGKEDPLTDKGLEPQPWVYPCPAGSAWLPPTPLGCSSAVASADSAFAEVAVASLLTSAVAGLGCQQTLGCWKELQQPGK